jgi:hypothetical protein
MSADILARRGLEMALNAPANGRIELCAWDLELFFASVTADRILRIYAGYDGDLD